MEMPAVHRAWRTPTYLLTLQLLTCCLMSVTSQNKELSYTIYEERPVPDTVGNVARDSNVSILLGSEVFSTLRYRILSQPDTNSELFSVGNTTGVLLTAARIDRESLCHFSEKCRLLVYVAMQQSNGPYFVTVKVNVYVRDVNDNDPQFPQASMTVPIRENTAVGVTIDITPAVDLDVGPNTIQGYTLVTADPTVFKLDVSRNLDGSLVPNLIINSQLDRETKDFYSLVIQAVDGGPQPRSGVLTLNITVDDDNDNPPVFQHSQYNVTVNETLAPRSVIAVVSAIDRDIGFNGEVRYRFSSRPLDDNANAFAIDESTGEIMSTQDLTNLQGRTLRLVVEAVDRGSKPLKAQALVNVYVADAVNNPPSIRLTTISGGNMSLVKENAQLGYVVAHFIIVDVDSGTNGIVSCSSSRGNFALQRLNDDEYKITLFGPLDRETRDRYDVQVKCWDFGRPSLSSAVPFTVIVEDVNDNPPVFARPLYRRNVTEEQGPDILLKVSASDRDEGENGRVTYRLGNVTTFLPSLITVMPTSGEIMARTSFDRELYRTVDFTVVAEDHGNPKLSAHTRVILDIIDINDRKPSVPVGYTLEVMENQPPGTLVGTIKAIDEDEGVNGEVEYRLLADNEATHFFEVDRKGVVRTRVEFDRESRDHYELSVLAMDNGEPRNENVLSVGVEIADQNDSPPRFLRPNETYNAVNISSAIPAKTVIFLAKASDADLGVNAQLDFDFAGDGYGTFVINRSTGAVATARELQPRDAGTYTLVLVASDRGIDSRSAVTSLTVVVVAENGTMMAAGQVNEDHIIVVVVLVCLTVLTAACVTAILLRLRHSDGRDRHPPPSKAAAYHLREVKGSGSNLSSLGGGSGGRDGGCGGMDSDGDSGRGRRGSAPHEKGSWGGYDAVKGHGVGVEETGAPDMGRDSDDDLILFKLQLAEQYKERDLYSAKSMSPSRYPLLKDKQDAASSDVSMSSSGNDVSGQTRLAALKVQQALLQRALSVEDKPTDLGLKGGPLDKPGMDEMLSSSSRETNGTDSGRGGSEDDSQAVESVRSDTESGFSSFLAMPVKDGWRHVGTNDYKSGSLPSSKPTAADQSSQLHTYGNVTKLPQQQQQQQQQPQHQQQQQQQQQQGALRPQERPYVNSLSDLDQRGKPGFEPGPDEQKGSLKTFRTFTPKRPTRTVHFDPDATKGYGGVNGNNNISNGTHLPSSKQTVHWAGSGAAKSREPRFQPQFQSSRLRSNPAHSAGDFVSNGVNGGAGTGGGGSGLGGGGGGYLHQNSPGETRRHGELVFQGAGPRDVGLDSLSDSGDEGNTTTTSGSYAVDHDEVIPELQSNIFV